MRLCLTFGTREIGKPDEQQRGLGDMLLAVRQFGEFGTGRGIFDGDVALELQI